MTAVLPTRAEGVFTNPDQAQRAVSELVQAGFDSSQIDVGAYRHQAASGPPPMRRTKVIEARVAGVFTGGVLGSLLGAASAGLIPAIEPILQMSIVLGVGGGAIIGALVGGIAGSLVGRSLSPSETPSAQGPVEPARTLVSVPAQNRYQEVVTILRRHGALGKGKPLI